MISYTKESQVHTAQEKRTQQQINQLANKKLNELYAAKGELDQCQAKLERCWGSKWLSFAHLHKRIWYRGQEELLASYDQTIRACVPCHMRMEENVAVTKRIFNRERPQSTDDTV